MRRLFLVAALALLSSGLHSASAQTTWYGQPIGPPAFGQNSLHGPLLSHSAAANASVAGFPGAVSTGGGCAGCATAPAAAISNYSVGAASPSHPFFAKFAASPLGIGQGCASGPGCSSFAQTRTFQLGSCRQFFNPGNQCGGHCGSCNGSSLFGGPREQMIYGPGGLTNPNPCVYGSYQNR